MSPLFAMKLKDLLAACGRATRACAPTPALQLVIADLRLPGGEGADLLPGKREEPSFGVILMTSFGNEQVAAEAIKAGALEYVVKSPEARAGDSTRAHGSRPRDRRGRTGRNSPPKRRSRRWRTARRSSSPSSCATSPSARRAWEGTHPRLHLALSGRVPLRPEFLRGL